MNAKRIKTPVIVPPDTIILELTEEEASILKKFVGSVSGELKSNTKSRKFYDLFGNIFTVLNGLGVQSSTINYNVTKTDHSFIRIVDVG